MKEINLKEILCSSCSFKIKCIKIFDFVLGGFLCSLIKTRKISKPLIIADIRNVLIIRPGGIGDAVLLIPMIKECRRVMQNARIDCLADKRNQEVFSLEDKLVDNIFCYNQGNIFTLVGQLRRNNYDLVIDTEQWHNLSAVLVYFLKAKMTLGFNTRKKRANLYTHLVNYSQTDYEANSFLNLLSGLVPAGINKEFAVPFLKADARSSLYLDESSYGKKKIILSLSASVPERKLSVEKIEALAAVLIKKGFFVVLIGGKKEVPIAELINGSLNRDNNLLDLVGKLDLKQVLGIINSGNVYVGSDSGILHLAYALGIPTVALFGAGIKEKWSKSTNKDIVLDKMLDCSPCTFFGYTAVCNNNVECLNSISIEEVLIAIDKLILKE